MGLLDNIFHNQTSQQGYYNNGDYGNYQFTSLNDIINYFMVAYVGKDKIISKVSRTDVAFHAQRALAELSFDTFKSCKAHEITIPASLQMILPQDYVNYTKVSWVDSAGVKHLLYPASKTSNPTRYQIESNGEYLFDYGEPIKGTKLFGNLIPSGNLIQNSSSNLMGGTGGWQLNAHDATGNPQSIVDNYPGDTTNPITDSVGWFWDNNTIIGYNLPQWQTFRHSNVPIYSGEEYEITYTLSGYDGGSYEFVIVDENSDYTSTTTKTADGTYTQTITASNSINPTTSVYEPNSVFFRNTSATAGNVTIDNISIVRVGDENPNTTWENYKSGTPSENQDDYQDDTYWPMEGSRYGLDPQHAQANGSFYIDCKSGKIHFSSNISGKTVILDYISDSLGTDGEMQVHKFAEEAIYKWMAYAILSTRPNIPEYIVQRYKKERFAETRKAKLRLSNIKLEEITQIFRGKSKQIKH